MTGVPLVSRTNPHKPFNARETVLANRGLGCAGYRASMPIHFAAARCAARSPVARALAKKAVRRAANDNLGGAGESGVESQVLGAALRHFAEHGLRAAEQAASQAEQAWHSGEFETSRWWTEVCFTLDRGMALALRQRLTLQDAG